MLLLTSMGTKSLWSSSKPTGESSRNNSLTPTLPALLPPPHRQQQQQQHPPLAVASDWFW